MLLRLTGGTRGHFIHLYVLNLLFGLEVHHFDFVLIEFLSFNVLSGRALICLLGILGPDIFERLLELNGILV